MAVAIAGWMVIDVLGIGALWESGGLSEDDAKSRLTDNAVVTLFFDLGGLLLTTVLLAASFAVRLVGKTRTTRLGFLVSLGFYALSFFKISAVTSLVFANLGALPQSVNPEGDTRIPSSRELVVGPGEKRSGTTAFLDPAVSFHQPSCVPAAVSAKGTGVDVDSRASIDAADYARADATPRYSTLTVRERSLGAGLPAELSVSGRLDKDSLPLIDAKGAFPGGFEVADAEGKRLAWCFKPKETTAEGSFATGKYHSPVKRGVYTKVIPLDRCN